MHWFVMWVDGTMHLWPSPWLYKGRFVLKSSRSSRYQLKCECDSLGSWVCIKSVYISIEVFFDLFRITPKRALKCFYCCFQIFTNVDKVHAAQVLNMLGLEDWFEGLLCFETLNPPHLEPIDCMMASDSLQTLITLNELNGHHRTYTRG
ncbi:hypothetical protein PRUPE_3G000800 [Prunus persica]|uniref:Uncharacterized protein n=1 Tax=Prunus persica TaxID=3760 RepID=A0A251PT35_PRUPE|nr:hypothetical protein PRUPE_3G000800 [Prunus persica]